MVSIALSSTAPAKESENKPKQAKAHQSEYNHSYHYQLSPVITLTSRIRSLTSSIGDFPPIGSEAIYLRLLRTLRCGYPLQMVYFVVLLPLCLASAYIEPEVWNKFELQQRIASS